MSSHCESRIWLMGLTEPGHAAPHGSIGKNGGASDKCDHTLSTCFFCLRISDLGWLVLAHGRFDRNCT